MKELSFLLDICPFVGGVKMLIEAVFKKEMTGTELSGKARSLHFLFAIVSLVLDFSTGIGGSIARIFAKGFLKRFAVKVGGETAGKAVTRVAENRAGRMIINSTEKRIKRKAEEAVHDVGGYKSNSEEREKIRQKYDANTQNNANNNEQNVPQTKPLMEKAQKLKRSLRLGQGSKENIKKDEREEERKIKVEQQRLAKENRVQTITQNDEEYSDTQQENKNLATYLDKKKAYASFVGDFGRKSNPAINLKQSRDTIVNAQRWLKQNRLTKSQPKNVSTEPKKIA